MAEKKRITLHPLFPDGTIDGSVNLYPKTMKSGIVDDNGEPVELQDKLVSGTNIKTINGASLLGSGNIEISITTIPVITITQAMITGYGTGGAPYGNPWYRFNFGTNNQYLVDDKYDTIKLDITAIRTLLNIPTNYLYLKRNATNSDQDITLYQFFIDDSGFDYSHIQDQIDPENPTTSGPYIQIGQIGDAALIYEPTSGVGWLTNRNINPTDIYSRIGEVETNKLGKVTSTSSAGSRVYAVDTSGNQEMIVASSNATTAYTIVRRNNDLGVTVPQTPVNNTDAASKKYVDDKTVVNTGLYKHTVTASTGSPKTIELVNNSSVSVFQDALLADVVELQGALQDSISAYIGGLSAGGTIATDKKPIQLVDLHIDLGAGTAALTIYFFNDSGVYSNVQFDNTTTFTETITQY